MTNLVVSTKTVHSIDYSDFEESVKDYYGVDDYSFPADAECRNDTAVTVDNVVKEPLDGYNQEDLNDFRTTGEYSYIYQTLLQG